MYTRLDKRQGDFIQSDTPSTTIAPATPKVVPAEPEPDDEGGGDEDE